MNANANGYTVHVHLHARNRILRNLKRCMFKNGLTLTNKARIYALSGKESAVLPVIGLKKVQNVVRQCGMTPAVSWEEGTISL